ncbi:CBS domain-containing protein [Streptomyces sp. DSM 116496]|uniref:CBS domain-containing protein n=1 Tax=Streptomyces stoeckheimensis TaxID=3344656 RepID=UPI0038B26444
MVSEADLLPKEEFHEHRPGLVEQMRHLGDTAEAGSTRAENIMTTPAVTICPDATLPQAAHLMADRHIKCLPVVDADGILKGIVSRADLLKVFLRTDEELSTEIRRTVVDRPLPPLPRSRQGHRDPRDRHPDRRGPRRSTCTASTDSARCEAPVSLQPLDLQSYAIY